MRAVFVTDLVEFQMIFPRKLFSPKIWSQINFKLANSWSLIEIKIQPLYERRAFAIFNRLYINDAHLLCGKSSVASIRLSL